MTADQAAQLLEAAETDEAMGANVVVSLLTGARTEELRVLTWTHVDLKGKTTDRRAVVLGAGRRGDQDAAVPPHPRAAGAGGRRPPGAPDEPAARPTGGGGPVAGSRSDGLVVGGQRIGRELRPPLGPSARAAAGLDAQAWTPRELRHSLVSLLSSTGMSIEDISHLVGHAGSRVTDLV